MSLQNATKKRSQLKRAQSLHKWKRLLLLTFSLSFLLTGGWFCSEKKTKSKVCRYEEDCKENERCTFEDPNCALHLGTCEGTCIVQKEPPKCACKNDRECGYPLSECQNCRCIKRSVQKCLTQTDCKQGYVCVGIKVQTCELRIKCSNHKQCEATKHCIDGICCNRSDGSCPRPCKVGSKCRFDRECFACGLRCVKDKCEKPAAGSCLGQKCTDSTKCASCQAKCIGGICQQQSEEPKCQTRSCAVEKDCGNSGGQKCIAGCCQ